MHTTCTTLPDNYRCTVICAIRHWQSPELGFDMLYPATKDARHDETSVSDSYGDYLNERSRYFVQQTVSPHYYQPLKSSISKLTSRLQETDLAVKAVKTKKHPIGLAAPYYLYIVTTDLNSIWPRGPVRCNERMVKERLMK